MVPDPRSLFMLHDILFQIRMEDLLITLHPRLVIGIDARKRPLVGDREEEKIHERPPQSVEAMMIGAMIASSPHLAPARLPIIQYAIVCMPSLLFAKYTIKLENAPHTANPQPTRDARITRGRRSSQTISWTGPCPGAVMGSPLVNCASTVS